MSGIFPLRLLYQAATVLRQCSPVIADAASAGCKLAVGNGPLASDLKAYDFYCFALGWFWSGTLRLYAGEPDLAIAHFEKSLRLSPHDLMAARTLTLIAYAHFFAGRFDRALPMLLLSVESSPTWAGPYRFLAACYAQLAHLAEARKTVRRLRTITTAVMESAAHWRNPEQRELYLSGLRLAAGEMT